MNQVTLSFDNGPQPEVTHGVLDVLERHDVRATFFVVGRMLDRSAEARGAVERARAAGHRIGNHSYTHTTPLGDLGPDEARAEITRCQQSLGDLADPQRLFRPFGGGGRLGPHLFNAAAVETLVDGGYECVTWNSVPGDWKDADGWVAQAQRDCARLPWALVVLHDIPGACIDRLDEFITWLRGEGHELCQAFPEDCLPLRDGRMDPDLVR